MNNKGFTLIEMLVAMGIFCILLVTVMNTFTKGFYYQKKIIEMQNVQREEAYLLEIVSREIRMATNIDDTQKNFHDAYRLDFTDHTGVPIHYCLADASGACSSTGKYFSVGDSTGERVVSSADIEVMALKFSTSQTFTDTQPLVTVSMQIRSKKDKDVSAVLQTSVSTRLYK
ncbi:MAG: type II secretion system protein [Candidatus Pacebacteria bacterium]|jgi:prepilin-type N-terminal cleavage/methylation domain-containing protein|nr:type II secretion system protein [Candidatus Paceibacterota bacterium]